MADSEHEAVPTQSITSFSKPNGDRIEIYHTAPLAEFLGADLLAKIRWWHNGSVRRSDSD